MAVTFTNIAVGEGNLFIGPSTLNPTADDATAVNVGATQDGIGISWEPSMVDIEVDQFGDAARVIQSRVKVMVKTKIAESTLTNLAVCWGYGSGTSTTPGLVSATSLNLGLHGVYPEEHYMKITANAPGTTATTTVTRTYKCDRAIQYETAQNEHKRDANVALELGLRILPLVTQTGKEYGTIVDS